MPQAIAGTAGVVRPVVVRLGTTRRVLAWWWRGWMAFGAMLGREGMLK